MITKQQINQEEDEREDYEDFLDRGLGGEVLEEEILDAVARHRALADLRGVPFRRWSLNIALTGVGHGEGHEGRPYYLDPGTPGLAWAVPIVKRRGGDRLLLGTVHHFVGILEVDGVRVPVRASRSVTLERPVRVGRS